MYNDRGIRSRFDDGYPNRRRHVEEQGRLGSDELLPTNLTGEVELIARASYMLGAAQVEAYIAQHEAYDIRNKYEETADKLDEALGDASTYRERSNRYWGEKTKLNKDIKRLQAQVKTLKNKINPPKPAVKKETK